ncbi:Response regulator receiver domain-containing protein [Filimonas lacunae]|uniref:Response regulator receiver domain-containing protein n=1 Tax=Filimonas lacunae TaxID=477680 RepID=A0A173MC12_9BACT|nr:sigma 54-interacting response regulator [Filimonas lacunae]BAV05040.1 formate hydrogenlyase transcriptional activator [Filimonas lacunae]SIT33604.1 Response regulator receiver domain-containing protein [Filimonas lacunae]
MKKKVLIVEDEFIVASNLRLVLLRSDYEIIGIATSADEAEAYLQKKLPDIVLLDISLQGERSGIDIARKLQSKRIVFIYLSANSSQRVLEEAKATEPYGFLVKPFRKKDLLIMLDIAWYRYVNSIETKTNQETLLQKQLTAISEENIDGQQQLLKMARIMQSYIPFDLMMSGSRPLNTAQFNDKGYLRIGFDEYQFIEETALLAITNLKKTALSVILANTHTDINTIIYNSESAREKANIPSLQKTLTETFSLQSYLVFPVVLSNGQFFHYFFYSRQQHIHTNEHIALLNDLRTCLVALAEKIIYGAATPGLIQKVGVIRNQQGASVNYPEFRGVIGNHHLLLSALDLAAQVAPYNTSVLILGESGTGKEKLAQAIHLLSPRKNAPYIKVNCAAIPATLIESELFGHEKGAFTGAIEKRKGKFEQAEGGTIFLDEIGELSLEMQVKILRFLQEKEIQCVGGNSLIKVNVRVVAATNRNLEKAIAEGNFRLDLYYRLNVFPITLPSLKERKSDIKELAVYFAEKYCREFNKPFYGIAASMMEEMTAYHWPGNIRELENVIEQSAVLNDGQSKLELKRKLTDRNALPVSKVIKTLEDVKTAKDETEREYIISILRKADGRVRGVNGAAQLMDIKPTTLESKMIRLNIRREDL